MKHSNYLIFGLVMVAVIVVFIIVLLIIKKTKTKTKTKPTQKDTFAPSSNCLKNPMSFSDVSNSRKCSVSTVVGKPAYILFIRHCDRGYKNKVSMTNRSAPCQAWNNKLNKMTNVNCAPDPEPNPIYRTTCDHKPTWTECPGCEYLEAMGGCSSNNCSEEGLNRAWALGKWVDCFAKSKKLHIGCVLGQNVTSNANARPLTTASIILDSLMKIGRNPCYLTGNKSDYVNVKKQVYTSRFNQQIAVVVWDHGQLGELITAVTGVPSSNPNIHWDDCCFDQVVVIDTSVVPSNTTGATAYNAKSLKDNDICGSKCIGKANHYSLCSYDLFSDKTSATICPT